jgi:hypothetical protein
MADSREQDPPRSPSEHVDNIARQERRDRREQLRTPMLVDETLLDAIPGEENATEELDEALLDEPDEDEVQACAERLQKINTSDSSIIVEKAIKKRNVPFVRKKPRPNLNGGQGIAQESINPAASQFGAAGSVQDILGDPCGTQSKLGDPSGTITEKADPCGAIPDAVKNNGAYSSVNSIRRGGKTNRSLRGGVRVEKTNIGTFANPDDDRINNCHTRFIVEKKQNISFSFDPATMMCYSCTARGGHAICGEEGGGARQCFILSDQTFPACLPCGNGECVKIIRVEDGALSELVTVWLEITKGKQLPAGSVVILSSATHLLMEGLEGYVEDMIKSLKKIGSIFGGGIIATPGIPIFLGGCNSPELIRDVWDLMSWLKCIEELKLWRGWYELIGSLTSTKGGGVSSHTAALSQGCRSVLTPLLRNHGLALEVRLYIMRYLQLPWSLRKK